MCQAPKQIRDLSQMKRHILVHRTEAHKIRFGSHTGTQHVQSNMFRIPPLSRFTSASRKTLARFARFRFRFREDYLSLKLWIVSDLCWILLGCTETDDPDLFYKVAERESGRLVKAAFSYFAERKSSVWNPFLLGSNFNLIPHTIDIVTFCFALIAFQSVHCCLLISSLSRPE